MSQSKPLSSFAGVLTGAWLPPGETSSFSWFQILKESDLTGFDLDLSVLGFYWELIRELDLSEKDRRGIHALLIAYHLIKSRGFTRVPLRGAGSMEALLANLDHTATGRPASEMVDRFEQLLMEGQLKDVFTAMEHLTIDLEHLDPHAAPMILYGDHLYDLRTTHHALRLLYYLSRHSAAHDPTPWELSEDEKQFTLGEGKRGRLDPDQCLAVSLAATGGIIVVSGGPGTGKTSVIVSILRTMARRKEGAFTFALAAPTGKAAYRMCTAVAKALPKKLAPHERVIPDQITPYTLHRLLEYSPRRDTFRKSAGDPLRHDLIIIDEASMVELALMDHLMDALAPGCTLVLVGDADQLPSVGGGAILRDLVHAGSAGHPHLKVALLRTNHRSFKSISDAAALMVQGDAFTLMLEGITPLTSLSGDPQGVFHVPLLNPGELVAFLEQWQTGAYSPVHLWELARAPLDLDTPFQEHHTHLHSLFTHLESSAILCATNELDRGTGELNRWFALRHPARNGGSLRDLLPGEPVIVTHNDYRHNLFNGDMGVVIETRTGDQIEREAIFRKGEGFIHLPLTRLGTGLKRAYAITVHKSQGSEYRRVVFIPPPEDHPVMTRELLYTAMTRARECFIFLGPEQLLVAAVKRTAHRKTLLEEQLSHMGSTEPSV